ncbi:MAG: neutral/alkaline non-lysosomal ceramidase N-terminal domain-containing protein [Deltaproteobacteria bacterium]|nr:neutral/alkaline non-lysosomal ceramidase N-terminal domain-containing protein [Deltaproteobacteria bacterium]
MRERTCVWWRVALLVSFSLLVTSCAGDDDDDDSNEPSGDDDAIADDDSDDDAADDDDLGPAGVLQVGAARVDISPAPDVSLKMGGYGLYFLSESMCRWSTGVHDPIYATAIAVEDADGRRVILIHLDVVGLITTDIVRIQQGVSAALAIVPDRVIVSASHSHQSPDTVGMWGVLLPPISGRDEAFIDDMIAGSVQAGVDAYNARREARISFGSSEFADLHYNSNQPLDPQAYTDDAMTMMAATTPEGEPIATLMNWACHPMVMGPQNTLISSDFLGPYYRLMDAEIGGINMFMNGSLGASVHPQNPYAPFPIDGREWGTWEDVENYGRVLADAAQDLFATVEPATDTSVDVRAYWVESKVQNYFFVLTGKWGIIPRDIPNFGENGTTTMTALWIGDVPFATVPGELVPTISTQLRAIMGGEHQFVINLGQDWIGYIITPQQFYHIAYIYNDLLSAGPMTGVALIEQFEKIYGEAR